MNGYKKFFTILCFSYSFYIQNSVTTLSGTIQFATTKPLTEPVSFKMHCNGVCDSTYIGESSTDYQHQYFTFHLPPLRMSNTLHVLITERIALPQKHELPLTNLKTHADYPYKLFKLVLREAYNKTTNIWEYTWNIQEVENTTPQKIVPENTIIVYMPPVLFERFTCSEKPMKHNHAKNFIKLPTLHTVQTNPDIIVQASNTSALASCDLKSIHQNNQPETIILCDSKHTVSHTKPISTHNKPWI